MNNKNSKATSAEIQQVLMPHIVHRRGSVHRRECQARCAPQRGCWARGALAGGFAFRGDSRWLGVAVAYGGENRDIVAGWCESGHLFAARVERTPHGENEKAGEKRARGE